MSECWWSNSKSKQTCSNYGWHFLIRQEEGGMNFCWTGLSLMKDIFIFFLLTAWMNRVLLIYKFCNLAQWLHVAAACKTFLRLSSPGYGNFATASSTKRKRIGNIQGKILAPLPEINNGMDKVLISEINKSFCFKKDQTKLRLWLQIKQI